MKKYCFILFIFILSSCSGNNYAGQKIELGKTGYAINLDDNFNVEENEKESSVISTEDTIISTTILYGDELLIEVEDTNNIKLEEIKVAMKNMIITAGGELDESIKIKNKQAIGYIQNSNDIYIRAINIVEKNKVITLQIQSSDKVKTEKYYSEIIDSFRKK